MAKKFEFLHSKVPYNFLGVDQEYETAKAVFIPVPYDSTTSYRNGARYGPAALITASRDLEPYDEELNADFTEMGFYTTDEIEPDMDGPEKTVERVHQAVAQVLSDGKFPFLFGGEHSLTSGALRAFKKEHPKMSVLHIDAHPDLRPEYEGTKYNHASVMHRALDLGFDVVNVGAREVSHEDVDTWKKYAKRTKAFMAREKSIWTPADVVRNLKEEVYITFDIDALDASIMPSTGTPSPGGLTWYEALALLRKVCKDRTVVGMDLMELAPIPGFVAPDFLAAKLAYKMTGYAFERNLKKR